MQTFEYRTLDKSTWGDGPWQDEPDKRQWPDAETGLPCLIVRSPTSGSLCGYVGVTSDHPAYRKHYDAHILGGIDVHGGLTFANRCMPGPENRGVCHVPDPGATDDVWWFGFDCSHYLDVMPVINAHLRTVGMEPHLSREDQYRDVAYVEAEVQSLARQLLAIQRLPAEDIRSLLALR